MSSFYLKLIAISAMIIDHVGAALYPQYFTMRIIGRLTMPVMSFLIGEGYIHTSNIKRYISRLALFALISEIPFDLALNHEILEFSHQNVFFTLTLGLVAIYFVEHYKGFPGAFGAFAAIVASQFIAADYTAYGVMLVLGMYLCRGNKIAIVITTAALTAVSFGVDSVQIYCLWALIPIALYNGKLGRKLGMAFYAVYPIHLLLIAGVAWFG